MADLDLSNDFFGTLEIEGTSEFTVTLDPHYVWEVHHTGYDKSGNDDGNSDAVVYLTTATGSITASLKQETGKFPLITNQKVDIGPGITSLYVDSEANADPVLGFSKKGEHLINWDSPPRAPSSSPSSSVSSSPSSSPSSSASSSPSST
jgi:hypothetical protein